MKFELSLLLGVFLVFAGSSVRANEVLDTPRFKIVIEWLCEEGCVSCNQIRYTGTSKTTKRSITLMGETVHTLDTDGVTPNKFLGYRFVSGSTEYFVSDDGVLLVSQRGKTLFEEKGKWVITQ